MVQFSVRTDSLGYTAASLSSALAQFDAQISAVSATVNGVVGGSWSGEAAEQFAQAWHEWLASAEITRASLTAIAAKLHAAEGGYETTESTLVHRAQSSSVTATALSSATKGGRK